MAETSKQSSSEGQEAGQVLVAGPISEPVSSLTDVYVDKSALIARA